MASQIVSGKFIIPVLPEEGNWFALTIQRFATYTNIHREFEAGCIGLLFSPAPSIFARQAYTARARIANALKHYFAINDHLQGSDVIQNQVKISKQYGLSTDDLAYFSVGMLVGILVNASPALFWCLFYVNSDRQLLTDLRLEIENMMTTTKTDNGKRYHTIDVGMLEDACPLLFSTYREVLRVQTQASTTRLVQQDTVLGGQYLLKKGSIVQIPGSLIHADKHLWGNDATKLDPRRFLQQDAANKNGIEQKRHKPHPRAYRAWGGGMTMCPGRYAVSCFLLSSPTPPCT